MRKEPKRIISFLTILIFVFTSVAIPAPVAADDIEAVLDSNTGSSVFEVQDSDNTEVFHVDSDGNVMTTGCLRVDASGAECAEAEGLVVDGNLGIGVSAPLQAFHLLRDDATASGITDLLRIEHTTSGSPASGIGGGIVYYIEDAGGSEEQASIDALLETVTDGSEDAVLRFSINTSGTVSEIMRIDGRGSGNVGIGTTGPLARLHVVGGDVIIGEPTIANGTAGEDLFIEGNLVVDGNVIQSMSSQSSFDAITVTGNSFLSTSSGNVGIGLTTPSYKLDATSGTTDIVASLSSSDANAYLRFADNTTTGDTVFLGAVADDLTLGAGADINLTATSDVNLPTSVGLTFADDGEKIEGDGTNLTIESGADINLTATADVNLPTSVGLTFGDDGEKIEGDGTDLTIESSNILRFDAGATERLVILANGNIGVGTSVPAATVHIGASGTPGSVDGPNDVYILGSMEVDGTLYGDGSGLTSVTAAFMRYDDIITPDANSTIVFGTYSNAWTTTTTDKNFFTITNSGDFGDVSLLTLAATGTPTEGTILTITNTTAAVDTIVAPSFKLTQSGNTGIGTTVPSTNLHVYENNTDTVPAMEIEQISTGDAGLQFSISGDAYAVGIDNSDEDKLKISYASAAGTAVLGTNDRLIIKPDGNIGIGTTAADALLHVDQGDVIIGRPVIQNGSAAPDLFIEGNLIVDGNITQSMTSESNFDSIRVSGNSFLAYSSGNVGIGQSTASYKLDATSGTTDIVASLSSTDANAYLRFADNTTTGDNVFLGAVGDDMTLGAGTDINLTATADVNLPTSVGLTFADDGEKIEGDGTNLTIESGADINLTATADVNLPTSVGLTFSDDGEKIEGDGTNLTIESGADINLTATADINIPTSVGLTFADDGEKIESDGSNLTIASGAALKFTTAGEEMTIAPDGNVGIGVTAASTNVHISESNTDTVPALEIEQLSTGDTGLQFSISGDSYALGIDNDDGDAFKISYASSEGTAAFGTNDYFTLLPNGNLGIGVTTPLELFHIVGGDLRLGNGSFDNASASEDMYVTGNLEVDGNVWLGDAIADNITVTGTLTHSGSTGQTIIDVDSLEALLVRQDGDAGDVFAVDTINSVVQAVSGTNVGIGVSAPRAALEIDGDVIFADSQFIYWDDGGAGTLRMDGSAIIDFDYDNNQTDRFFRIQSNNGTALVTVIEGGNVGIGTTGPTALLQIAGGDVVIDNNRDFSIKDASGTARQALTVTSGDDLVLGSGFYDDMVFQVGGGVNEAVRIRETSGNVGIGTSAPTGRLQISNGDVKIGTGTFDNASSADDLYVTGNLEVDGSVWLGDATTDSLTVTGTFANDGAFTIDEDSIEAFLVRKDGDGGDIFTVDTLNSDVSISTIANLGVGNSAPQATLHVGSGGTPDLLDGPNDLYVLGSLEADGTAVFGSNIGVGMASPEDQLDVQGDLLLGNDHTGDPNSRTNATRKSGDISFYHFTNAEEKLLGMRGDATTASEATLFLGGTSSVFNAFSTIAFYTALNSTTTAGTERMRISSDGNIGIATTAPRATLHVGSTGTPDLLDGPNDLYVLGSFEVDGTATFAGNVGIGTTSPNSDLQVVNSSGARITLSNGGAGTGDPRTIFNIAGVTNWGLGVDDSDSDKFKISQSSDLETSTRFTIINGGNIGLGTDAPAATLHVGSTGTPGSIDGPNDLYVLGSLEVDGTLYGDGSGLVNLAAGSNITANDTNVTVTDSGDGVITMTEDGAEIVRISAGNVGIGTTAPSTGLNIISAGASLAGLTSQVEIANTGSQAANKGGALTFGTGTTRYVGILGASTSGSQGGYLSLYTRPTSGNLSERLRINQSGNVGIATTGPLATLHVGSAGTPDLLDGPNDLYVLDAFEVDGTATFAGNVGIGIVSPTSALQLPQENDATTPTLSFGDGDSGFYEVSDDVLGVAQVGSLRFQFSGGELQAATAFGVSILDEAASSTNPVIAFRSDVDTGLGRTSADVLALISGGVNVLNTTSAGNVGIGLTAPLAQLHVGSTGTPGSVDGPNDLYVLGSLEVDGTIFGSITGALTVDGDLEMSTFSIDGDSSAGLHFDPDNDGTNEVKFNANGNVGIGTTSPNSLFEISATAPIMTLGSTKDGSWTANEVVSSIDFRTSDSSGGGAGNIGSIKSVAQDTTTTPNGALSFWTGATAGFAERVRIDNDGNVGIGTTAPGELLHVAGNIRVDGNQEFQFDTASDAISLDPDFDQLVLNLSAFSGRQFVIGGFRGLARDYDHATPSHPTLFIHSITDPDTANDQWVSFYHDTFDAHIDTGVGDLVLSPNSGNVGIGTSAPDGKLHAFTASAGAVSASANGDELVLENSSTTGMSFLSPNTATQYIIFGDADDNDVGDIRYNHTDNSMRLTTNAGAGFLHLTSAGNVGIGTSAPAEKLDIAINGAVGVRVSDSGDSGNERVVLGDSGGNGGYFVAYNDSESAQAVIRSYSIFGAQAYLTAGNVGIGTSAPRATLHVGSTGTPGSVDGPNDAYILGSLEVDGTIFGAVTGALTVDGDLEISTFSIDGDASAGLHFDPDNDGTNEIKFQADGNVGIGTTVAERALHVRTVGSTAQITGLLESAGSGDDATLSFEIAGTEQYTIGIDAVDNKFKIGDGASVDTNTRVAIDSSGNVGVGTTAPGNVLEVFGDSSLPASSGTAQNGALRLSQLENGLVMDMGASSVANRGAWIQATNSTNLNTTYPILLNPNGGNVGIGTTITDGKLHVFSASSGVGTFGTSADDFIIEGSGNTGLTIATPNTAIGSIFMADPQSGSAGGFDYNHSLNLMRFINTGNIVAVIDSSGNVGVGSTNPGVKFNVVGGAGWFDVTGASNQGHHLAVTEGAPSDWRAYPGSTTAALQIEASSSRGLLLTPQTAGNSRFMTSDGFDIYTAATVGSSTGTHAMTITSGQNVGIGISTPLATLHVGSTGTPDSVDGPNDVYVLGSLEVDGTLFADGGLTVTGLMDADGDTLVQVEESGDEDYIRFDTAGSERMIIHPNGNVGIGTTGPLAAFEVAGEVRFSGGDVSTTGSNLSVWAQVLAAAAGTGTAGAPAFSFRGDTNTGMYSPLADTIKFSTASADRVTILADGKVGIGDTTPSQDLEIGDVDGSGDTQLRMFDSGADVFISVGDNSENWAFGLDTSAQRAFAISGASDFSDTKLTILPGGNVGIGTTAPTSVVHAQGQFVGKFIQTGSDGQALAVNRNVAEAGSFPLANFVDDHTSNTQTTLRVQQDGSGDIMNLFDGGTEVFTVLDGGNVGIGTTAPDTFLEIEGSLGGSGLHLDSSSGAGILLDRGAVSNRGELRLQTAGVDKWYVGLSDSDDAGDGSEFFIGEGGGGTSVALWIESGGNVGLGGVVSPLATLHVGSTGTPGSVDGPNDVYILGSLEVDGTIFGSVSQSGDLEMGTNSIDGDASAGLHFDPDNDGTNEVKFNANGNVGIGTTAPAAELHIYDASSESKLTIQSNGANSDANINLITQSSTWAIYNDESNLQNLKFYNSGDKVTIKTDGNVGIGTTGPLARSHVFWGSSGATKPATIVSSVIETNSSGDGLAFLHNDAESARMSFTTPTQGTKGIIEFFGSTVAADSTLTLTASGTVGDVTIAGDGNVGIGTTAPSSKLFISASDGTGFVNINDSANPLVNFRLGGTLRGGVGLVDTNVLRLSVGATGLVTDTKMAINTNGNVGIGTTAPAGKLYVVGASADNFAGVNISGTGFLSATSDNSTAPIFYVRGTGTADLVNVFDDATEVFTIRDGGNVGIGTTGPAHKLEVRSGGSDTFFTSFVPSTGSGSIRMYQSSNNHPAIYGVNASGTTNMVLNTSGVSYLQGGEVIIGGSASTGNAFQVSGVSYLNGNVGIATSVPRASLHVGSTGTPGSVDGPNDVYILGSLEVDGTIFGSVSQSGDLEMGTNSIDGDASAGLHFDPDNDGTNEVKFNANGNVGIGITAPSSLLTLLGSTEPQFVLRETDNGNDAIRFQANTARGYIGLLNDGTVTVALNGQSGQNSYINSGGNVGIGTTGPLARSHVFWGSSGATKPATIVSSVIETNSSGDGLAFLHNDAESARMSFTTPTQGTKGIIEFFGSTVAADSTLTLTASGTVGDVTIAGDGNVGIGTTAPAGKLYVVGASADNFAGVNISGTGFLSATSDNSTAPIFYVRGTGTADLVNVFDDGTEVFTVLDGGNVGVGSTGPGVRFNVVGGGGWFDVTGASNQEHHLAVTEGAPSDWRAYPGSTTVALQLESSSTRGFLITPQTQGNSRFMTSDGFDIYTDATVGTNTGTHAMTITSGQNVGIGISVPVATLHVGSTGTPGNVDGPNDVYILGSLEVDGTLFADGGLTVTGLMDADGDTLVQVEESGDEDYIRFDTAGSERMIIHPDGNVGIGITGPTNLLDIVGTTTGAFRIARTSTQDTFTVDTTNSVVTVESIGTPQLVIHADTDNDASDTDASLFFRKNASTAVGKVAYDEGIDRFVLGYGTDNDIAIDTSGNVGIGSTGPSARLQVAQDQNGITDLNIRNNTGGTAAGARLSLDVNSASGAGVLVAYDDGYTGVSDWADSVVLAAAGAADGGIVLFSADRVRMQVGAGTDNFTLAATGNIGIGVTAPASDLHVLADGGDDGAGLRLERTSSPTGRYSFKINTGGNFVLSETAVGDRLTVRKTSGNVGIGTTSPIVLFEVEKGGSGDLAHFHGSTAGMFFQDGTSRSEIVSNAGGSFYNLLLRTGSSATNSIFLGTDGNVGIGTTAPDQLLEVAGSSARFHLNSGGFAVVNIDRGGTNQSSRVDFSTNNSANWLIGTPDSDDYGDGTDFTIGVGTAANQQVMTMDTSGNVGIGTTNPTAELQVFGNNGVAFWAAENTQRVGFEYDDSSSGVMNLYNSAGGLTAVISGGGTPLPTYFDGGGNVGIGTTGPISTLDVDGSVAVATVAKTGNYVATAADSFILVDASSGDVTITLPEAGGANGRIYHVKKTDSSGNSVIIDGDGSQTIDDATTQSITAQYQSYSVVSDGSEWWIF